MDTEKDTVKVAVNKFLNLSNSDNSDIIEIMIEYEESQLSHYINYEPGNNDSPDYRRWCIEKRRIKEEIERLKQYYEERNL